MNFAAQNTDTITDRTTTDGMHQRTVWSRGVYLITPDDAETDRLLARVDAVLGHAALLQYRNKSASPALRVDAAEVHNCTGCVPLIVNDDLALASAVGADGVHLGEDDGDTRTARLRLGPDAIIGVSCYDDPARARAAAASGAFMWLSARSFRLPPNRMPVAPALIFCATLPVTVCRRWRSATSLQRMRSRSAWRLAQTLML